MASESVILGMGNPLLDISAVVKPEMLAKYNGGLKPNDAILYESEDIFEELVKDYEVEYIAGGATQNSCRVAQWILKKPESVAYFGCVGKDETFETLKKVASEAGVKVLYQNVDKPKFHVTVHRKEAPKFKCLLCEPLLEHSSKSHKVRTILILI